MTILAELLVKNYYEQAGRLSKEQLGDLLYDQWNYCLEEVFDSTIRIVYRIGWTGNTDDIRILLNDMDFYNRFQIILKLIGEVNGALLRQDEHLGRILVAYSYRQPERNYQNLQSTLDTFKLKAENLLARMIIEQSNKSQQIILDEKEDLKLLRKMHDRCKKRINSHVEQADLAINNFMKQTKTKQPIELLEVDQPQEVVPIHAEFTSAVVLCHTPSCKKHHELRKIKLEIDVMLPAGTVVQEVVSAGWCEKCKIFFLSESVYNTIREKGILLCQIISAKAYSANSVFVNDWYELKAESLLHQSGYSVSETKNLTTIQRQEILRRLIDKNLYTKSKLISFFNWLIKTNEQAEKKDMSGAIIKWKMDREFVLNL